MKSLAIAYISTEINHYKSLCLQDKLHLAQIIKIQDPKVTK
jgi:hypothetical protein